MITAICGDIGSGKSFKQLEYGLSEANKKRKILVCNFALNKFELKRYCALKKYGWIGYLIDTNQIVCLSALDNLESFVSYPNSVCLLDEAGIFLNTREFAKTPKKLLQDLAQSRKFGADLIYCAQFDDQVDKQLRLLTQYFVVCQSVTIYDRKLKRPKMVWKDYKTFKASDYWHWSSSPKSKSSFFQSWLKSFKSESGFLQKADLQLFRCFDSFSRLDRKVSNTYDPSLEDLLALKNSVRGTIRSAVYRDTKRFLFGALQIPPTYP